MSFSYATRGNSWRGKREEAWIWLLSKLHSSAFKFFRIIYKCTWSTPWYHCCYFYNHATTTILLLLCWEEITLKRSCPTLILFILFSVIPLHLILVLILSHSSLLFLQTSLFAYCFYLALLCFHLHFMHYNFLNYLTSILEEYNEISSIKHMFYNRIFIIARNLTDSSPWLLFHGN